MWTHFWVVLSWRKSRHRDVRSREGYIIHNRVIIAEEISSMEGRLSGSWAKSSCFFSFQYWCIYFWFYLICTKLFHRRGVLLLDCFFMPRLLISGNYWNCRDGVKERREAVKSAIWKSSNWWVLSWERWHCAWDSFRKSCGILAEWGIFKASSLELC